MQTLTLSDLRRGVKISGDEIVLSQTNQGATQAVSVGEIVDFMKEQMGLKEERGAIAVALLGASVVASKNPKISRRFWSAFLPD